MKARDRYPLFTDMIVGRFDSSVAMYRIFDERELKHILSTGRLTGGQYAVKAEREHGASWGSNITEVITWGNGQRGKRLGEHLYLAKLDAFDTGFAHLDPGVEIDPNGAKEQRVSFNPARCNTGIGCSFIGIGVNDVDFYSVSESDQLKSMTLAELKAEVKEPATTTPAVPVDESKEVRDPSWGLKPKDKVVVTKGSRDLGIGMRTPAIVRDVWRKADEREVRVKLFFPYPRKFPDGRWTRDDLTLYAMHPNRLSDNEVALMNSRHDRILVRKK
jgi:hypothetical protein